MQGKTILIVDDEPAINEVIKASLELEGFTTISSYDGMQALQIVRNRKPDLILLDINMPAAPGTMVYDRLKMMYPTKDIPIIFVTAASDQELADIVKEKNIDPEDVIQKPINFAMLLHRIKALLS